MVKVVNKVPGPYVRCTRQSRPTKVPYIPKSQALVLAGGWPKPARLMHVAATIKAWTLTGKLAQDDRQREREREAE